MNPHLHTDRRGALPFSAVAVTVLIVVSAYAVMVHCAETAEESADATEDGTDAVEKAIDDIRSFVDTGMGELIYGASTDADLGDMASRIAWFEKSAEKWMADMFPVVSGGVTAELKDFSITAYEKLLRTGETEGSGYTPSYIYASGTFTAVFGSNSGTAEREVPVASDASCILPLAVSQGSLFENAVEGQGSLLSQMMTYQLQCLAQYRVMNGYGLDSAYGPAGTYSILTEDDVERSYRLCTDIIRSLYLRDADGLPAGDADVALLFLNGESEIDLTAVYAHALYGKVDDVVAKWFDYFLGNRVLELCDWVDDRLRSAWDALTSFITGRNTLTAEPYIRGILSGDEDLDLRTGETFTYTVEVEGYSRTYEFAYPSVDLMGSDAVNRFKEIYRNDTNSIREWLTSIVNSAVRSVAEAHGLPAVRIGASASGDFVSAVSEAVREALDGSETLFWDVLLTEVDGGTYPDRFYSAIYNAIIGSRDSIFAYGIDAFVSATVGDGFAARAVNDAMESTSDAAVCELVEQKMAQGVFSGGNAWIYEEYRAEADRLLSQLSALCSVESDHSSIIEKGCLAIVRGGILTADICMDVAPEVCRVTEEFAKAVAMNAGSDTVNIPGERDFTFAGDGGTVSAVLVSETVSSPNAAVGRPDGSKSSHDTGFGDSTGASFCTVIPVSLRDGLTLTVSGSTDLTEDAGAEPSRYRAHVDVDLELDVSVVSGYALVGVDYSAGTDIIEDAELVLMGLLMPFVDDLRELLGSASRSLTVLSELVSKIADRAGRAVEMLYEKLIGPVQKIAERIKSVCSDSFCSASIALAEKLSAIVDIGAKTQTVGIRYMGFELTFTFYLNTLMSSTKHICNAVLKGSVGGADISASVDLKVKTSGGKYTPVAIGKFDAEANGWSINGTIDPFLYNSRSYIVMAGTVKGVDFDIAFPTYEEYRELDLSLQDVPALGAVLNNIPFVIPGTKISIDAGVDLKYDAPVINGVLINEFEPNPAGTDRDCEWAEIINLTGTFVDLEGWTVATSTGKVHLIGSCPLSPGERTVVYFEGTFVNNSKEYLILKDADGTVHDTTDTMSDGYNDDRTCQRAIDGCTTWKIGKGSEGERNVCGVLSRNGILADTVKDILTDSAKEALSAVGKVNDTASLAKLIRLTLQYALNKGIDQLSSCLIEAMLYVEVEIADVSSSGHSGFRVFLSAGKELAGDVLKYIVGRAESLVFGIEDPYNIDLGTAVSDDIFVGMTVYGGLTLPSLFGKAGGTLAEIDLTAECNLSAIRGLMGHGTGTPEVRIGLVIKAADPALFPSYSMSDTGKRLDIWLMKASFRPAS